MFKILVADDERFIRQGIISVLMKNIKGEITCIEASNGIEALQKAEVERPNLIITDICMPGSDGLEFISRLKEIHVDTPVIILSGYENFDYAKRAIKLGVKEYVMKPVKKAEFIELIQGCMLHIQERQKQSNAEAFRKIEHAKIMEKLKSDFLIGLLKCRSKEEAEQYLEQLEKIGMRFESKYYTCAVIEYEVNEQTKDYMGFAVKNVLDEYLSLETEAFLTSVEYKDGVVVAIFEGDSREQLKTSKKRLMIQAVQLIKEYCKTKVYVGLGDIAYDSLYLYKAIDHAFYAADMKLLERGEMVSVYEECKREEEIPRLYMVKEMKQAKQIDLYHTLDQLQAIYTSCRKVEQITWFKQEYEAVIDYLKKQRSVLTQEGWIKVPQEFSSFFTILQLKKELKEFMKEVLTYKQEEEGSGSNAAFTQQILQYVEEHITEDLDLGTIASRFKRTPGYISTLFKKHVDGGFNYYINKERMEIAKKLLKDHSLSIQEVSELTGYHNAKYFSVVFKKLISMTPREYRDRG